MHHPMHHTVPMYNPAGVCVPPPLALQQGMAAMFQVIPSGMAPAWCVMPALAQGSGIRPEIRMVNPLMGVHCPAVAGAMPPLVSTLGTTPTAPLHPPGFHGQLTKEQYQYLQASQHLHQHQMKQMEQRARAIQQPFLQGSRGQVVPQLRLKVCAVALCSYV